MTDNPRWIKLQDHLINLNNVGGFLFKTFHDGSGRSEITIQFPASKYSVFFGTIEEGERTMKVIKEAMGIVSEVI